MNDDDNADDIEDYYDDDDQVQLHVQHHSGR